MGNKKPNRWGWIPTLGWARMEASSCVHWLVSTLYSPLLEGRLRVAITDIIFCRPVVVMDTVMEGAEARARARPMGHARTVTGSWMWESCTEPRSLTTGSNPGISSSARSSASSSSASARELSTVLHRNGRNTHVIHRTFIVVSVYDTDAGRFQRYLMKIKSVKSSLHLLNLTFHFFQVPWMTAAALSHLFTFLLTSHERTAAESTKHFTTTTSVRLTCLAAAFQKRGIKS